jgi:long-chain fatty acid transport protein
MKYGLGVLLSLAMTSESFAVGTSFIGNEVPGARGAGQGYIGVAGQSDDPATVFLNPGGITNLPGTQATFGATFENIHGSYKDNSGNQTKERVVNALVPNMSVTQTFFDDKLGVGISLQSPFGLETDWDANSPLRYVATNSRLRMVDVTPAVAYKISPMFSIGVGVDYDNVFDAQLDKHINNDAANLAIFRNYGLGGPTSGSPDGIASLKGSGADWGYHAGFVFQPTEQHALGVTYHSKVNVRINGNETVTGITGLVAQSIFGGSNYSTSAYTDIVLPQSIQFGYAFKPNHQWMLEADAAWYHWSDVQDLNVRFPAATANQQALLGNMGGTTNITPLNARDAWSMSSGINYKVNERWQIRGGFWYEPWMIPEADFSPAFMDQSRYGLSSGAGYALTSNLSIDVAYNAIFTHRRVVNNNVGENSSGILAGGVPAYGIPSADISGTYSNFGNSLAVNLTYRFGNHMK